VFAGLIAAGVAGALIYFLGDDDGGSEEFQTYFDEVAPLINDIDDRDFQVQNAQETFLRYATFLGQTATDIGAVTPPEQAAAAHEELIAGLNDGTTALTDLYDQHSDVATIEEATAILQEDPAFVAAYNRALAACTELKALADSNGVDVTLDLCASVQPSAAGR
jgi:hypothetical protein